MCEKTELNWQGDFLAYIMAPCKNISFYILIRLKMTC